MAMKRNRWFTPIEITIVLIIVCLLGVVVRSNVVSVQARDRKEAEIRTMRMIANAYEQHALNGHMDIGTMGTRTVGPSGADNKDVVGTGYYQMGAVPESACDPDGDFIAGSTMSAGKPVVYVRSPGSEMPGMFTLAGGYKEP